MTPKREHRITEAGPVHDQREIDAVLSVLQDGLLELGPNVAEFERRGAELLAKRHGVMVNSGTSALWLAVDLLECEPGDEVITSPLTFSSDIAPLVRVSETIVVVSVPASSSVKTLGDLVAAAQAEPDKLNAALVPGITEWAFLGFLKHYGLAMSKVPYRDIMQAVPDLSEARVQVMMSSLAVVQPAVQAGKVRLIAVTGRQRVPQLPDIPTSA